MAYVTFQGISEGGIYNLSRAIYGCYLWLFKHYL